MKQSLNLIIALLTISIAAQAQEKQKNNLIKINPFGAFASAIPLSYERLFANGDFSVVAGGTIISSKSGSGQSTYDNNGFAITPEVRCYFYNDPKLPTKIYTGLYFNYEEHKNMTLNRYDAEIFGYAFGRGGGILLGNQWFFANGFVVDFYVGPGYMKYERSDEFDINISKGGFLTSITGPKNTGTKVRFGFSLGISF